MRTFTCSAAAVALLLAVGGTASADCAADAAKAGQSAGVSKDGSLAPLEQPAAGPAGGSTAVPPDAVAKDGGTVPLNGNPDVATSQQDVESQQHGGQTAAASGQAGTVGC